MMRKAALAGILLAVTPAQGRAADAIFHLTEVLSEQEISPRQAQHVTRWEGDYYVTDDSVSVLGWGVKGGGKPIPFDTPHTGKTPSGSNYQSIFHRRPDGLEVVITYDSYVLERRVIRTGPQTCKESAEFTLRPGHLEFEVHRNSNGEPMIDRERHYIALACSIPPLVG